MRLLGLFFTCISLYLVLAEHMVIRVDPCLIYSVCWTSIPMLGRAGACFTLTTDESGPNPRSERLSYCTRNYDCKKARAYIHYRYPVDFLVSFDCGRVTSARESELPSPSRSTPEFQFDRLVHVAPRHVGFHGVLHRRVTGREHDLCHRIEIVRVCEGARFVCGFLRESIRRLAVIGISIPHWSCLFFFLRGGGGRAYEDE